MSQSNVMFLREPAKWTRVSLLLAGIVLGQLFLYGPAFAGRKALLPLDVLTGSNCFIPRAPGAPEPQIADGSGSDLVLQFEPARRFAISEFRQGRLPTWAPYGYGGAPFTWPLASPFNLIQLVSSSPMVLSWSQMLVALVAGTGMYVFLRQVLRLHFWAACVCAWCYPISGFFILWRGFFMVNSVAWLPWLFLAVERSISGGSLLNVAGLALVTFLILNGQLDVAGQVLLISGIYALWRVSAQAYELWKRSSNAEVSAELSVPLKSSTSGAFLRLASGWGIGLMLAAFYILPLLEYSHTGARMVRRSLGSEERPPVGLSAVPQVVLPDMYGTQRRPSLRIGGGFPQKESTSAGYVGITALLLFAPLAFVNRRMLGFNFLWLFLFIIGLGWSLNVPGIVTVLRLPGLNMMSHNRLVFISGFSILCLAGAGLNTIINQPTAQRRWMYLPLCCLLGFSAWSAFRTCRLPSPVARDIPAIILRGGHADWVTSTADVSELQSWFKSYYAASTLWCSIGVFGWILVRIGALHARWALAFGCVVLPVELLWFGYGRETLGESSLYYPPVPVLAALSNAPPGRIMGYACLPANLAGICNLRDIRGYDAVEPSRLVALELGAGEPSSFGPSYASTIKLAPRAKITREGKISLPPVLDMLNVRYVLFRGVPFSNAKPIFQSPDYWVLENPRVLPRAFVPRHVEVITNDAERLARIESDDFNPREVAFVEESVTVPSVIEGSAEITHEVPSRIDVSAEMKTAGMVVLADLWDKGWSAYLNGKRVPILRANHAVRGVLVGPGKSTLEFRYVPAGFMVGLGLAGVAALAVAGCAFFGIKERLARRLSPTQGSGAHEEQQYSSQSSH